MLVLPLCHLLGLRLVAPPEFRRQRQLETGEEDGGNKSLDCLSHLQLRRNTRVEFELGKPLHRVETRERAPGHPEGQSFASQGCSQR